MRTMVNDNFCNLDVIKLPTKDKSVLTVGFKKNVEESAGT